MSRRAPVVDLIERRPSRTLDATVLGRRLRELRKQRHLTQGELSRRTTVATSTISKVENNQLSPSFETLLRLAEGLDVDLTDLLAPRDGSGRMTRLSITRGGQGDHHDTQPYHYEFLSTDLTNKRMHPLIGRLKAKSKTEFGELLHHPGEELFYVLQGEVELRTEQYGPARLAAGDCAYLDSTMGHGCISVGAEDAVVFWVSMVS